MTPFDSILVANRGEIALRIMRTAREAGLRCIAVYTEADKDASHVRFADQAVCIGLGPVEDSYLSIGKVIDAARESGAQAIHPGYGFLSESAEFANACAEAGLVFIGPSAQAIALMGNKAEAKRQMIAAGVPCVPGYEDADQSDDVLAAAADRIGYPVMIKAAAGGGGRGMRVVADAASFADALSLARAEAKSAFGSDEVILEKAIRSPRHVEFQVFADRHGTTLHMGERDCSVQRRHQKVVEESPCPVMNDALRSKMGAAAVDAARAISYEGAGTVEFLLDGSGEFYFLEMNTRLQVEHPVTEMVTGLDLVALQLKVARGEPLGLSQQDIRLQGYAMEVRLYAEDAEHDFLPQSGSVVAWHPPAGKGIRVDDGLRTGLEVSPYYDPMLAKIIAYGDNREEARRRLIAALQETALMGVTCNRDFLIRILTNEAFVGGSATTAFIGDEPDALLSGPLASADRALGAALLFKARQNLANIRAGGQPDELLGWGSPGGLQSQMLLELGDDRFKAKYRMSDAGLTVCINGESHLVTESDGTLRIDGHRIDLRSWLAVEETVFVATGTRLFEISRVRPGAAKSSQGEDGQITAPMHGNLLEISVSDGDHVDVGTRLAVLEAMKLQHEILSPVAGRVSAIAGTSGRQVRSGELLIEVTPDG